MNPIQSYKISTNISTGNYFDGQTSNIVESIPIGRTSTGSLTEFDSNHPTMSLVSINTIDRLVVTLLDNHGNPVDLTNGKLTDPEDFSIELAITQKK